MQTPQAILLRLDGSARTAERIQLARRLTEAFNIVGQRDAEDPMVRRAAASDTRPQAPPAGSEAAR